MVTCALFATATGIVGAVVTLMGLLAFPAMLRAGYDIRLASGVICAGGCLGILIPPSVMLILYGATAGVSVPKLYAGALFPGLMLAGLYILYVLIRCMINPSLAPKLPIEERRVPLAKVMWSLATSFFPLALLILSVLGAIFFGIATPTEAAAVGALGSLLLAAAYRSLTFGKLKESVYPHRPHLGHGLLALRRLLHLLVDLRLPRRASAHRKLRHASEPLARSGS